MCVCVCIQSTQQKHDKFNPVPLAILLFIAVVCLLQVGFILKLTFLVLCTRYIQSMFGLVWFLCLMAYQCSWVICRGRVVILFSCK